MLVVNFYAGPGAGKSTIAAGVYAFLKQRGYRTELVPEVAKWMVWYEDRLGLLDQPYVTFQQAHKLMALNGKIDVAIVDSPLLLGAVYNQGNYSNLRNVLLDYDLRFDTMNYLIVRDPRLHYENDGRIHNFDESVAIDEKIATLLDECGIPYEDLVTYQDTPEGFAIMLSKLADSIGEALSLKPFWEKYYDVKHPYR